MPKPQQLTSTHSLPFLKDNDCALGIAVKHYLDELAAQSDPTSSTARESIKEKGSKSWFPHAVDFADNLASAFELWDAVYAAVEVASTDLVKEADKKNWNQVNEWLKERR